MGVLYFWVLHRVIIADVHACASRCESFGV